MVQAHWLDLAGKGERESHLALIAPRLFNQTRFVKLITVEPSPRPTAAVG